MRFRKFPRAHATEPVVPDGDVWNDLVAAVEWMLGLKVAPPLNLANVPGGPLLSGGSVSAPELQRFQVQEINLGTDGKVLRCRAISAGAPGSANAFSVGSTDVYVKKRHAHALLDELYAYRPNGKTDLTDFIPSGASDPIVVEWLECFGPPKKGKYKIVQEIDDFGTTASDYPHFHL